MVSTTLLSSLVAALIIHAPVNVESVVAGVDFGGEFFKVALVQPGSPFEIVTNVHSKRKTETMVAFDGDDRLYGADAANIGVRRPADAFCQIRRFIGNTPEHPFVQDLLTEEYMPYELLPNTSRGDAISLRHAKNDVVFQSEELVAMVFNHARDITNEYARAVIKDWVITYPMFFSQAQKQALLDAASLVGVRVLSLIEENTAAALQLGIDTVAEEPRTVLYYNMGSTSTQVSVVTYSSYVVPDGFKKNKTVGHFEVRGKAWDETLGGASFDLRLANYLANVTNDQFKLSDDDDIRSKPRAWAKLRALAKKTKIVLSANAEIPVVSQSLYNDMDLNTHVTRADFEVMCSDLYDRVLTPVTSVLSSLSLQPGDISEVEIIGGGVRMPRVQSLLKSYFDGRELSVHLNGDEAMALGAAFRGANISNAFRVRNVGMVDITPVSIGVHVGDKPRTILFQANSPIDVSKTVSFTYTADDTEYISAVLFEAKDSTDSIIGTYGISGADAYEKELRESGVLPDGQGVKVSVTFVLDGSSMVGIKAATASFEQEIIEEEKEATTEEETAAAADAADEKKKKKIKKHSRKLQVTYLSGQVTSDSSVPHILPMSVQDKADSVAMLEDMQRLDNIRRENAEAKNALEAYVYSSRDTLRSSSDEFVSTGVVESQAVVDTLLEEINENEDWLYDEGENVDAFEYKKRLRSIKTALDGMTYRLKELLARPAAVKRAKTYVVDTTALVTEWITDKPQITEAEREGVLTKLKVLEEFVDSKVAEQEGLKTYDPPAFGSSDVLTKLKELKRYVVYLSKKPVPPPVVVDNKDDNSTSSSNDTTTTANSGTEEGKTTEEAETKTEEAETKTEEAETKTEEEDLSKASEDVDDNTDDAHSEL